MTFFSVLFALFAEQYRPVGRDHWIGRVFRQWVYVIPNYCDTGEPTSAKISTGVLRFFSAFMADLPLPSFRFGVEYRDCLFLYGFSTI